MKKKLSNKKKDNQKVDHGGKILQGMYWDLNENKKRKETFEREGRGEKSGEEEQKQV